MPQTAINATVPSTQELLRCLILHFLSVHGERTEYELDKLIGQRIGGGAAWRPSRGTIGSIVRELIEKGYVEGRWEDLTGRRKRPVTITPEGEVHLQGLRKRLHQPVLDGRRVFDRLLRELFQA